MNPLKSEMTPAKVLEILRKENFKNLESGNLFNFFICQYAPDKEYEWRRQILEMQDRLKHPTDYLDVLALNLFDVFCDYLQSQRYMGKDKLRYALDRESREGDPKSAEVVQQFLTTEANDDKFFKYLNDLIIRHVSEANEEYSRPYVFFYGISQMYPYLRANILLAHYEKYNKTNKYKIILFYPGKTENTNFKLFGILDERHTYHSHMLIGNEN